MDSLTEELAALRAEIARLRAREQVLERAMEQAAAPTAALRPGWPIRRLPVAGDAFH